MAFDFRSAIIHPQGNQHCSDHIWEVDCIWHQICDPSVFFCGMPTVTVYWLLVFLIHKQTSRGASKRVCRRMKFLGKCDCMHFCCASSALRSLQLCVFAFPYLLLTSLLCRLEPCCWASSVCHLNQVSCKEIISNKVGTKGFIIL